jgi:hypothetical protein
MTRARNSAGISSGGGTNSLQMWPGSAIVPRFPRGHSSTSGRHWLPPGSPRLSTTSQQHETHVHATSVAELPERRARPLRPRL